jgi:ABC-type branched-subunit amino acid transport system substrate-binding protein
MVDASARPLSGKRTMGLVSGSRTIVPAKRAISRTVIGPLLVAALGAMAMAGLGCGGAPPARPWIEEELGGGFGEELGQHHVEDSPSAATGDPGGEPGEPADPQAARDAATALRELDAAAAVVGRAAAGSGGPASAALVSARARLDRALLALPPAALGGLEERAARWTDPSTGGGLAGISAALHAARLFLHAGSPERAAAPLARARAALAAATLAADVAQSLARQLDELAAASAPPSPAPGKVAVLLPLSGRFAAVGQELRRAIELGRADGAGPGAPAWQFLDTRGDPAGAEAAVAQAADGGAVAILGPVGDREAVAAARRASQRGVPIALLSPGDGADLGLGVFRLGWSAQDEARAVASWAQANDYQRVAVLAPRDDVGELAAAAFAAQAQALGLTLAASGQYDAVGGSVEADIKRFLGLVPAQNPRLAAHLRRGGKRAWQTFVPDIPFSLLYIPDRADRAALVAAFLPYLGLELRTEEIMDPLRLRRKYGGVIPQVVQLVGGAGWNSPTLPARGGNAVQGALIFDVCTAQRDDLAAERAGRLEARLGHAATSAAAQAYDAASWLARSVAAAPRQADRAAVRAAMAQTRLEEGACGPLAIGADGEVIRESAALQVDGDELILAP